MVNLIGVEKSKGGEKSCWFHVGQFDFVLTRGHTAVKHGVKNGAADGEDELVRWNVLHVVALADPEVHVGHRFVVEHEAKPLFHRGFGRLPVVMRRIIVLPAATTYRARSARSLERQWRRWHAASRLQLLT